MIRDPQEIVTSNSHGDYPGEWFIGWEPGEGKSLHGLSEHWEAMRPYLFPKRGRGAFIVRYDELLESPNDVQDALGKAFDLTYDQHEFSHWPDGFKVEPYWLNALGKPRDLKPRKALDHQRLRYQQEYSGFRDCVRQLGYELR